MQPNFLESLQPTIAQLPVRTAPPPVIRTAAPAPPQRQTIVRTAPAPSSTPTLQLQGGNTPQIAPARPVQPQQSTGFWGHLGNVVSNDIVRPAVNDVRNALDVGNALRQDVQGLAQVGTAAITHNPVAENNAINRTTSALNNSLNASRGLYTPAEANSNSFSQAFVHPLIRGIGTYAPYAVGGGVANAFDRPLLKIAASAASNYLAGTGGSAARQFAGTGKVNLRQAAISGLPSAAFGGALEGAAIGAPKLRAGLQKVAQDQSGFIGKRPTSNELRMGAALGMSPEDVMKAKQPTAADLQAGNTRPFAEIQTQIEAAHNAGNNDKVAQLIIKLPQSEQANMRSALGLPAITPPPSAGKGFVLKEGKVIGGQQQVIRAARNPQTGKLELHQDTIQAPPSATKTARTPGAAQLPKPDTTGRITSPISGRQVRIPGDENTLKNPIGTRFAKQFPQVQPGDYGRARAMVQQASNPITVRGDQAAQAIDKALGKNGSLAEFGKAVENGSAETKGLNEAVKRTKDLTNTAHAVSQALGGNTNFIKNFFSHNGIWDLSKPEDAARFEELAKEKGQVDPYEFGGIDRQPRVFNTIAEGEHAGFKVRSDISPSEFMKQYADRVGYALRQQALAKGFTEADMGHGPQTETYNMGTGDVLRLSKEGKQQIQGFEKTGTPGAALKGYRTLNRGAKETLLSVSQFHPININALQGAPTLLATGHPILAAKGLAGTFGAINKGVSDKIIQKAVGDGTIDAAATMGTPIKYGSDYSAPGHLSANALRGEKMIFERQLPAMHIQLVRAAVNSLQKSGIDLKSPEARDLGLTINKIMGYVNTEVENHNPQVQKALSDIALAPQFTRAKWELLGKALNPVSSLKSGNYARAAVLGKFGAELGLVAAGGAALGGKQNNFLDNVKQTLISPAIPTGMKDSKGNTIKLRLPANFISEAAGLAAGVNRGANGRLGINLNPAGIPGNLKNYGTSRLAVLPGDALKLATNTDFAGKPLYDNTAPAGVKAEQALATLLTGSAPIGAQGIAQTKAVTSHLPTPIAQVLNNERPGSNPILKGVLSALGATPETDKTTGKGLQTTQYYTALDKAKAGLNANDLAAFNSIHQQTKDPVTGQYVIKPTVFDGPAKAELYLQHPNVLSADTKLNQSLQQKGQKIDPFFNLSPAQQKAYMVYQTMAPLSADRTDWQNKNNSWYQPFAQQQTAYFNGLPKADPNRPTAPIKFPAASPGVQSQLTAYDSLPKGSPQATQFLNTHPDVINFFADATAYDNAIRVARGYAAVKQTGNATPQVARFMNQYNAASKAERSGLRSAQPQLYQQMIAYYDNLDLASLTKQAGVNQLAGEPDTTSKELKQIQSLASDIYQTGTSGGKPVFNVVPAGWMLGLSNKSSGGSGFGSSGTSKLAGGAPVFKAPTSIGNTFSSLASLLKGSERIAKPKSLRGGGKLSHARLARAPRRPSFPKPYRAESLSLSSRTGQRVKLAV